MGRPKGSKNKISTEIKKPKVVICFDCFEKLRNKINKQDTKEVNNYFKCDYCKSRESDRGISINNMTIDQLKNI
jgi:Zn finger protein HypA/HybF involved in hydrogenase expression